MGKSLKERGREYANELREAVDKKQKAQDIVRAINVLYYTNSKEPICV